MEAKTRPRTRRKRLPAGRAPGSEGVPKRAAAAVGAPVGSDTARQVDLPSKSPARSAAAFFPIVAIGASAGGVEAFKRFFEHMPPDSGMAFVLIPHLDPTHKSLMVELLGKETRMSVVEAEHGMLIRPNHVYVIPPNKYLAIRQRRVVLSGLPAALAGRRSARKRDRHCALGHRQPRNRWT